MRRPWTLTHISSRLSIASVDGKQHFAKIVFSALVGFSLEGKMTGSGSYRVPRTHRTCWSPQTVNPTSWTPESLVTRPGCTETIRSPSFSLQWKSDESSKHYLAQILIAINWSYWQAEKIHAFVWSSRSLRATMI